MLAFYLILNVSLFFHVIVFCLRNVLSEQHLNASLIAPAPRAPELTFFGLTLLTLIKAVYKSQSDFCRRPEIRSR